MSNTNKNTDQNKTDDKNLINDLLFWIQNILSESDYKEFIENHLTESQKSEYE